MSGTGTHLVVGALAGALPDIALVAVIHQRTWLPPSHPVIRAHRWLHTSPWSLVLAAVLGWGSHLVLDRFTRHQVLPGLRVRRGWRW